MIPFTHPAIKIDLVESKIKDMRNLEKVINPHYLLELSRNCSIYFLLVQPSFFYISNSDDPKLILSCDMISSISAIGCN